jgi:3-oxoacyl-[acyl-carrier-protein] synthase II
MTGHLLGAAGAVGVAVCALSIEHNQVHPTINLKQPDPECDLDYVKEGGRHAEVNAAMSNSFGFGGHNAVIVLRRFES